MAGPYREKVFGLLAKVETTSGVDAVPTGASDAVQLVGIPEITYAYLEPGLRDDVVLGALGVVSRTAPAGRYGSVNVTLEVRGAGAAYSSSVKPPSDAFLRMAGFGVTTSFGAGVEFYRYATLDSGMETGTVYVYTANKLIKMIGCVALPRISAEATKRGLLAFTVIGRIASDPTETAIPALTFNATKPPLFHSGPAAIGSWTEGTAGDPLVLRRAEIDFATQQSDRPSAGATDGLIGFIITDRKPKQTMMVEIPAIATFDPFAISKAVGTNLPLSAWQVGVSGAPGQYNRMKVSTGRWALETPALGADRGVNTVTLTGNLEQFTEATSGREANLLFD